MGAALGHRSVPSRVWSALVAAGVLWALPPVVLPTFAVPADEARAEAKAEETQPAEARPVTTNRVEADRVEADRVEADREPDQGTAGPQALPAWMRIPVIQAPARAAGVDAASGSTGAALPGGPDTRPVTRSSRAAVRADGSLHVVCGFGGEEHVHASAEQARTAHAEVGGEEPAVSSSAGSTSSELADPEATNSSETPPR